MLILSGWKRMFKLLAPGLATFILIRLTLGWQSYNPLYGLNLNLENPLRCIYFFYMTFGWLWLVSLGGRLGKLSETYHLTLLLVIVTALLFSRLEESRISFLIFPWTIPIAIDTLRRLSIARLVKIAIPSLFAIVLIFEFGILDLLYKYHTFNWQWFDRVLFYSNASLTMAFCIYVTKSFLGTKYITNLLTVIRKLSGRVNKYLPDNFTDFPS